MLEVLKFLHKKIKKWNKEYPYSNHYLCNYVDYEFGIHMVSKFRTYLEENHPDGKKYVVFNNNEDRLKWLDKQIKKLEE
jgi:hypothetical protein